MYLLGKLLQHVIQEYFYIHEVKLLCSLFHFLIFLSSIHDSPVKAGIRKWRAQQMFWIP